MPARRLVFYRRVVVPVVRIYVKAEFFAELFVFGQSISHLYGHVGGGCRKQERTALSYLYAVDIELGVVSAERHGTAYRYTVALERRSEHCNHVISAYYGI